MDQAQIQAGCGLIEYMNEQPMTVAGHQISFHEILLIVCAVFGSIALVVSLILMHMHAIHYLKPWEQRHIIRILFMVPIYSLVSFLSYYFYHYSVYWELIRDCYEAFAIASFFTLLCHYVAPTLHDQKEYFRNIQPKNWFWPLSWIQKCTGGQRKGPLRIPKSGLTWFNIVWVGVFQYCLVRPLMTVIAVATQGADVYCQDSLSPIYAHIWVVVFECISVSIAMYCLIQFYLQMRGDLKSHRPFLKILAIKLVIFFCFWQTIIISFLASSSGPLKPTATIGKPDFVVGIPSMLLCVEMAAFAVMHIYAYPTKPYKIGSAVITKPLREASVVDVVAPSEPQHYQGGFWGTKAYLDAFNPWDIVKACGRAGKWLFHGQRHRQEDSSYGSGDEDAKFASDASWSYDTSSSDNDSKGSPSPPPPQPMAPTPPAAPAAYTGAGKSDVSGRLARGESYTYGERPTDGEYDPAAFGTPQGKEWV